MWTNKSGGFAYTYSATADNGQIQHVNDTMSGETIVYTYDSLRRLTQAASTPNAGSTPPAWTQQFQYDGFGNLTAKGSERDDDVHWRDGGDESIVEFEL